MRKGISPLLAWVLLVAFALVMGAFVMNWATNQVKQFDPSKDAELYFPDVDFSVSGVCMEATNVALDFNITNTGSYTIDRLTIARKTNFDALGSCYILNPTGDGIQPGENKRFDLKLRGTLISEELNQVRLCSALENGDISTNLISVEVVPWIKINNQSIVCSDSKKELNADLFINIC